MASRTGYGPGDSAYASAFFDICTAPRGWGIVSTIKLWEILSAGSAAFIPRIISSWIR